MNDPSGSFSDYINVLGVEKNKQVLTWCFAQEKEEREKRCRKDYMCDEKNEEKKEGTQEKGMCARDRKKARKTVISVSYLDTCEVQIF